MECPGNEGGGGDSWKSDLAQERHLRRNLTRRSSWVTCVTRRLFFLGKLVSLMACDLHLIGDLGVRSGVEVLQR